jgi:hypothetical protein
MSCVAGITGAQDLHLLVIGEGAAANCNEHRSAALPYVQQIGVDGVEKPAADPLEWSSCTGGSIWMPLARQLHDSGFAKKIVLLPVTLEKAKISDWLKESKASQKLNRALRIAQQRNIRFDYVLVQQGHSDADSNAKDYFTGMRNLVSYVMPTARQAKWIFSQGTGCAGEQALEIERAQMMYAHQPLSNRFLGAALGTLARDSDKNTCTFNESGQVKAAELWMAAIRKAATSSEKYRKEALLYYFR